MSTKTKLNFPLIFTPVLQEKIWGGTLLHSVLNKGKATDSQMGESWELSDNAAGMSLVREGIFTGQSLRNLFKEAAKDIFGAQWKKEQIHFPLLAKFICAKDKLSVQVHPGNNSPLGDAKTECWHVIAAPPRAEIIVGLSKEMENCSREEIVKVLQSSDCEKALNRIPIQEGDTLFIPAGTVHAITENLLIYEVQQNSDTTFRLYDWGRLDVQGKPRTLHLKEASQCLDLTSRTDYKCTRKVISREKYLEEELVRCDFFALTKFSQMKSLIQFKTSQLRILTCIQGGLRIASEGGSLDLKLGDSCLVPAAADNLNIETFSPDSEFLQTVIPN